MSIPRTCRFLLALVALLWLGAGSAWAASATFNGNGVTGCSYSAPVYTCTSFPLAQDGDVLTIASGYTVNVSANSTFTWGESLVMSGTAVLNVTGKLDFNSINPNNLKVSGGKLQASGAILMGSSSVSLTADVSADSVTFGGGTVTLSGNVTANNAVSLSSRSSVSGNVKAGSFTSSSNVTIGGSISATGAVNLGDYITVNGGVSGSTISNTGTGVTINGPVTATTSVTLPNGSTVNGSITAPVVQLQASGTVVNGAITATTSLYVGNKVTVNGDVTTGTLSTQDSDALINGNATVTSATLQWHARITKTVYCTGGTKTGSCDCVTNNSGYATGSAMGPTCASKQPPPAVLDHFLITHDGNATSCAAEQVLVTACADAACSTFFTGGVTGTVSPGGASFAIMAGSSVAKSSVKQAGIGSTTVAIASSSTTPAGKTACSNTSTSPPGSSCTMLFNGGVGMTLAMSDHQAGAQQDGTLTNAINDGNSPPACGPAFVGNQTVTVSCKYDNPATGGTSVEISPGKAGALGAPVTLKCNGPVQTLTLAFDASGSAPVSMKYLDVGALKLTMSVDYKDATNNPKTASVQDQPVVVAPGRFVIGGAQPGITAGKTYALTVQATDLSGKTVTPNFGKEKTPEAILVGYNSALSCDDTMDTAGAVTATPSTTQANVFNADFAYPDAGPFRYATKLKSGKYLGVVDMPVPSFADTGCSSAPRAYPAWFKVEAGAGPGRTKPAYYYSGQPIDVKVTAMNAKGAVTPRYEGKYSYDVQVSIVDPATQPVGIPSSPTTGAGLIAAGKFNQGVGSLYTVAVPSGASAADPPFTYTFKDVRTPPTTFALRAVNKGAPTTVSSADVLAGYTAEDSIVLRSGRIRIGSAFGDAKGDLKLPVTAEYFDQSGWRRNKDETFAIPPNAISVNLVPGSTLKYVPLNRSSCSDPSRPAGTVCLDQTPGQGFLTLRPQANAGVGAAFVAINLGTLNAPTVSNALVTCLVKPADEPSTADTLRRTWLRSLNGICADPQRGDPVGRATFGVFKAETKRVIHVREVFN